MRKIMSSLMVLTLIVLFAMTFYCSSKAEEVFQAQVEQLNKTYPGMFQVAVNHYQRGLLVSNVQTSFSLEDGEALLLDHQIRHFPWGVRIMTRLPADSALALDLAETLPIEDLQLQTDVSLTGSAHSSFKLPELNFSDSSGQLAIKGVVFDCDLEGQLTTGNISFELGSLEVRQAEQAEIVLAGLRVTSQFVEQQGLPLGQGKLQLDRLRVQLDDRPGFELNKLAYEASSSLQGDQLATELDMTLAGLSLAGEAFSEGQLKLSMSGIKVATVRELQQAARELQAEFLNQQADPLVLQLQLLGLYSQLLKDGLTLSLETLKLKSVDGNIAGRGLLEFNDLVSSGAGLLAVDKIKAQFELNVDRGAFAAGFRLVDGLRRQGSTATNPAVLTEQAEQLAGGLVQKGIFSRREDGGYRVDISLDQGQGLLNGNPFKL